MSLYIGMDVHKKFTVATAMTEKGEIINQQRLEHGETINSGIWKDYLGSLPEKAHGRCLNP